ncbi:hypothetical protein MJO28_017770 [Puccinia striiformis f. sp. tritici]|nr:hypothetical protein MJO28_017770 [Puccinia striiformis f. sp. tritici]
MPLKGDNSTAVTQDTRKEAARVANKISHFHTILPPRISLACAMSYESVVPTAKAACLFAHSSDPYSAPQVAWNHPEGKSESPSLCVST